MVKIVGAAVAVAVLGWSGLAHAEGDPAAGEKVFKRCQACHAVGENAKNKVGPVLNGVVGREIAAVEDFRYSTAFEEKAAEGFTWTEENLAGYLQDPRSFIPKNKMSFAGLRQDDQIADVIAYLKQY
ncbi:MAG: c-type cytochrome [Geminicoccaceae bacterium]